MSLVRALGLEKKDLIPVSMLLNTAVEAKMLILGALFIEVVGMAENGDLFVSKQLLLCGKRSKNTKPVSGSLQRPGFSGQKFP